ncbi:hypothetical protein [Nocardioides panacisoli]|uniref:Uncharacterized protein n=1 Tax=Nocardioides panacisoli TaxID=627624 RepID=A0ABP7I5A0_9ACTN
MTTDLSELVASLHEHAQRAASEAQAVEDPSTQRAITELAGAVQEIARHLKDSDG